MRIGVAWEQGLSAANYRAIEPLHAMERLGHEVAWPASVEGVLEAPRVEGCGVLHVFRRVDSDTWSVMHAMAAGGAAITWDVDDDLAVVPEESPNYHGVGGEHGERIFRASLRVAKLAHVVTVTNDALAHRYRDLGIDRVRVIPNQPGRGLRKRERHDGIVVGWVGGLDHRADVPRLGLVETFERLLARHPELRVECIGVDLGLSERYRHTRLVPFEQLPDHMARWDVGIAPLADIPFNHTRSDIKPKEYAASGVPWLASRLAPYAHLGEGQGGVLVDEDGWFDAIDALIADERRRRTLAKTGLAWARTQRIDAAAARWEAVFQEAVDVAGSTGKRMPTLG